MKNTETNKKIAFQFKEKRNTVCITCCHVLNEKKPILYVGHDADDGMWQFLCGDSNHTEDDAKVVSLEEIVKRDQSLNALYEMPRGVCGQRSSINSKWEFYRIPE